MFCVHNSEGMNGKFHEKIPTLLQHISPNIQICIIYIKHINIHTYNTEEKKGGNVCISHLLYNIGLCTILLLSHTYFLHISFQTEQMKNIKLECTKIVSLNERKLYKCVFFLFLFLFWYLLVLLLMETIPFLCCRIVLLSLLCFLFLSLFFFFGFPSDFYSIFLFSVFPSRKKREKLYIFLYSFFFYCFSLLSLFLEAESFKGLLLFILFWKIYKLSIIILHYFRCQTTTFITA